MSTHKSFLTYYLIFFVIGFFLIAFFNKGEILLFLNNELYSEDLGVFFKYITYLGDGILLGVLFVISLLYKYRYAIIVALSSLLQLILVHINKRIIFDGLPRPKVYFNELGIPLKMIDGVDVHSYNTFPSGHTATVFSLFFILAMMANNKKLNLLFIILAVLVGISRIYILQHFFIDVYFGSLIGIISVLIAIYIYDNFLEHNKKLEKGILNKAKASS